MRDKSGRLQPPLTQEERAGLIARLKARASEQPDLSPEQRAELRRHADNLEKISAYREKKWAQPEAERQKPPSWTSPEELSDLFGEALSSNWGHSADELTYDDMLNLADVFTGWAMNGRTEPYWSTKLLGWAESFESLAARVGPDWHPPEPTRLSLIGFVARQVR